jgi:ATP-dependent Clp protease ATP-binding subunit ClpB
MPRSTKQQPEELLGKELDITKPSKRVEEFSQSLHENLIGQEKAVDAVVEVYNKFLSGMINPNKPIGNFLFLGPTGTGKTKIVEVLAETLFNNPKAVIKIDCAEFAHSHEIAKLIGSPPGYLGHRETHPRLSQEVINSFQTDKVKIGLILFDEIEKASDALWNLMLGILDKATLTLGDNRKVDFSRCFVFMTSNCGAGDITKSSNSMGFTNPQYNVSEKTDKIYMRAVKSKFTPEFINRLDKICVFNELTEEDIRDILDLELKAIQVQLAETLGADKYFRFRLSDAAKDYLIKNGINKEYGARYLKRTMGTLLLTPFANLLGSEQIGVSGYYDHVLVDYKGGETFSFYLEDREKSKVS